MKEKSQDDLEPRKHSAPQNKYLAVGQKPLGQARILTTEEIARVEKFIDTESNSPHSDRLKFYLSVYAGLRVGEICDTYIADLVQKDGSIASFVRVRARNAKGNRERSIPMHPKIHNAVKAFMKHHPDIPFVAFSHRSTRPKKQSLTALTNYLWDLYAKADLPGCSSHSGRRTFITNLARNLDGSDYSLRDVQILAGHAQLNTTERYIGLAGNLYKLVGRLK